MNIMKHESSSLIAEYSENRFYRCQNAQCSKLLVFLPSVNGKGVYPYFPRLSWGKELSKEYNVLYISDPYQPLELYNESMGSWFISPDGILTLETLARQIEKLIIDFDLNDVLFYGSSMGGYAAIVLSSYIDGSMAVAECPQLYLNKHPGSRYVCNKILSEHVSLNEVEPLHFLRHGKSVKLKVICSAYDRHYTQHILPFVDEIKDSSMRESVDINFDIFIRHDYEKGHVALKKEHAFKVIEEMFSC